MKLRIPPQTRKEPRQARARETVEAILTAAARILTSEGFGALTTNRVAEVAGVSVGSLYQYFPNKEALVRALSERHTQGVRDRIRARFEETWDAPLETVARMVIQGMVEVRRREPRLHQELLRLAPVVGGLEELCAVEHEVQALLAKFIRSRPQELPLADPAMASFILCHAVEAAVHNAVLEKQDWLKEDRFVEETAKLVVGFFKMG